MEKILLMGVIVYTSDELKKELIKFIDSNGRSVSKKILIDLVNKGVLIPIVIKEIGSLTKLIAKIRKRLPTLYYLGGVAKRNKCYVIISKNLTPKYKKEYSIRRIIDVALHESIHIAFEQNPEKFTRLNSDIYREFYSSYYKNIFDADKFDIARFLLFRRKITYWKIPNKGFDSITLYKAFKDYSKLDNDELHKRIKDLKEIVKGGLGNLNKYRHTRYIVLLRKTYKTLFNNTVDFSMVGQELWEPSEIISILSGIKPNHPNVIKSLKLIVPGKELVVKK